MHEDEDVELMLAFQTGDYNAFGVLAERWQPTLVRFFFAQSRDLQLAEDCAQEVWRKIFRSRADYAPRARFRTFLMRVARNYWIDVYRSRGRDPLTLSLEGGSEEEERPGPGFADASAPDPTEGLTSAERSCAVHEAIALLPDAMRDVFVMAEIDGLKYQEIAEILDIPVGTVKSRMFNAVRRLRELLERRCP